MKPTTTDDAADYLREVRDGLIYDPFLSPRHDDTAQLIEMPTPQAKQAKPPLPRFDASIRSGELHGWYNDIDEVAAAFDAKAGCPWRFDGPFIEIEVMPGVWGSNHTVYNTRGRVYVKRED